ncbi:MAG: hypothetical protein WA990_08540 [Rubrobacteraceae bacterium]
MQEAISAVITELALALLALVATVIGAYGAKGGKAVKDFLESRSVERWSAGLANFSPLLHRFALQVGELAEELVRDAASDLIDPGRYDFVKSAVLKYASEFEERTGVKWRPSEEELDSLIRRAIREGRIAFLDT